MKHKTFQKILYFFPHTLIISLILTLKKDESRNVPKCTVFSHFYSSSNKQGVENREKTVKLGLFLDSSKCVGFKYSQHP